MKKVTLLSLFLTALLFLIPLNAFACSCPGDPDATPERIVPWYLKNTYAIFTGEVIEVNIKSRALDAVVKLKIEQTWKTRLPEEIAISTQIDNGASCGYAFAVGKKFLVYAYGSNLNNLITKGCGEQNKEIKRAAGELKVLGKGKKPRKSKRIASKFFERF